MKPLTTRSIVPGRWSYFQNVFWLTTISFALVAAGCDSVGDSSVRVSVKQEGQAPQETKPAQKQSPDSTPVQETTGKSPQENKKGSEGTSALDKAVQSITDAPTTDPDDQKIDGAAPEVIPPHDELLPLIEKDWVRLHPQYEVWLDGKNKQVIVGGRICFRNGPLEMFACPFRTKEHESIVSTVSNGEIVHVGLLATGAIPGKPVQWNPDFVAASGPVVHITAVWTEDGTRKEVRAQQMIIDVVKNEPLQHDFVYCGSGEWRDPDNPSYREFWADSGDLICVSNFTTALMDLQIESSNAGDGLMFHANPDMIPELGKPVLLILKPEIAEQAKAEQPGVEPLIVEKAETESPNIDK